jgi:hypothetical protein
VVLGYRPAIIPTLGKIMQDAKWQAPVPYPTDGLMYQWDEATTDWKATVGE